MIISLFFKTYLGLESRDKISLDPYQKLFVTWRVEIMQSLMLLSQKVNNSVIFLTITAVQENVFKMKRFPVKNVTDLQNHFLKLMS